MTSTRRFTRKKNEFKRLDRFSHFEFVTLQYIVLSFMYRCRKKSLLQFFPKTDRY